jgi:hypothetical protein
MTNRKLKTIGFTLGALSCLSAFHAITIALSFFNFHHKPKNPNFLKLHSGQKLGFHSSNLRPNLFF